MALTHSPDPSLGEPCPDFNVPATDGKHYARESFVGKKALLVMFICNHCPYVHAVEERLVALGSYFKNQPVGILAICSNDPELKPADSFENMKKRAQEKGYTFPYAQDLSQEVARAFGAVCTPDFFLYDKDQKLAYRGRLDDSWKDPAAVRSEELKEAIECLVNGKQPSSNQRASMGCSIKWRELK